jgi:HEPN domain-containing protein
MSKTSDPLSWVEKAEEDFALARSSLRRKKSLLTGACFHAQEALEIAKTVRRFARGFLGI